MRFVSCLTLIICLTKTVATVAAQDVTSRSLLLEAQKRIADFQQGAKPGSNVLHLVYFYPNDLEPLPHWRERLERTMNDVNAFYRDGLRQFGLRSEGFPMARQSNGLAFHLVRGAKPMSGYSYDSGSETAKEIQRALKGQLDLGRSHVLVFYGLSRQEPDGLYVINAPYYGGGGSRSGLAHAADCEMLDPVLLTNKEQAIVYTEHYYTRKKMSLAAFNSLYLGGVAHELGHAFGLPHDAGSPTERLGPGTSLMGSGNMTYREDIWGGKHPTYLSTATALRLLSHPLFTGCNREQETGAAGRLEQLHFAVAGKKLEVSGEVSGKIAAYGMVAYVWHPKTWPGNPQNDHGSITYPTLVTDGKFKLELDGLQPGDQRLRFSTLHLNGAVENFDLPLQVDPSGQPDIAALTARWLVTTAEAAIMARDPKARTLVNEEAIAAAPTPEAQGKLRVLHDILDPPTPISLATEAKSLFLSDAVWSEAKVGYGKTTRNHYWFDDRNKNGVLLMLAGKFYAKGIFAHSSSRYVFELDRKWKTFTARVGLKDGAQQQGSAMFTVLGDGKELFRSGKLRLGKAEDVLVDVSAVSRLELIAEGAEGHNFNSWAIWVDPKVTK